MFIYDLKSNLNNSGPNIENCLFSTIKFLKNNNNAYDVGYGIGFDLKEHFSHPTGGIGQNVIIFGADMSYFHSNNKTKNILILGKGITQLYSTTVEKMYSINFTATKKNYV